LTYLRTRPGLTPAMSARYFIVTSLSLLMNGVLSPPAYKGGRILSPFRAEGSTKVNHHARRVRDFPSTC
jgi:hypothetical protein